MEATSSHRFNSIYIFGGASPGKDGCFIEAAINLGRLIAEKQIHLVYGGGSMGLMGRIAGTAYMGGVKVLVIIPKPLAIRQLTGVTIRDELRVSNMQDRMINMMTNADAFITLPGDFGTPEELFHVVSWAQLNIHQKPVGILNIYGFFDGLLSFLDYTVERGFITQAAMQIIISVTTPNELISKLLAYVPEPDPALANVVLSRTDNNQKRKWDLSLTL